MAGASKRVAALIEWPKKTQELINAYVDSTIWDRFAYRDDDIVIANWGKSGCTWLQQLVVQLIFQGEDTASVGKHASWLELAFSPQEDTLAALERQTHRRVMKTHLPVDAIVYHRGAKYLYIGRDGRDVAWSLFNHFRNLNDSWYSMMHRVRGEFGPLPAEQPRDFRLFFARWLIDGFPLWPFWPNVTSWWNVRGLPNLMLIHYTELKKDLAGTAKRIAQFLEIEVAPTAWPTILKHCSLDHMRKNAGRMIFGGDLVFRGGARAFFNAGANADWRGILDLADERLYLDAQSKHLHGDCAHWLETGTYRASPRIPLRSLP
jgi:aryl sulfotransferase